MATVNIRRDVKDSFYRYKMPKLISKVSQSVQSIWVFVSSITKLLSNFAYDLLGWG
jgi:translation initiation factor 5